MKEILKDTDELCYKANGKAVPNEKHNMYWWGQDPRARELSAKEFNDRMDRLLKLYKGFGFEVVRDELDSQGKRDVWIERPSQCTLNEGSKNER